MRYWVRIEKETKGPFTPEQLRRVPGIGEEWFICPEGSKEAEDWRRLKEFKAAEGASGPAAQAAVDQVPPKSARRKSGRCGR